MVQDDVMADGVAKIASLQEDVRALSLVLKERRDDSKIWHRRVLLAGPALGIVGALSSFACFLPLPSAILNGLPLFRADCFILSAQKRF